jgi:hypothetical protein
LIRVLLACEDAGGARALAPVVDKLLARGDIVDFLLGPVAARCLHESGIASDIAPISNPSEVDAQLSRWRDWHVLVTASTPWGLRLEARAVLAARAHACPSLTFIDFPAQYRERLSFPERDGLCALPDRVAAIDWPMRDDLLAIGVAPERIVATGSPAFDAILAAPAPIVERRADTVLFLSQPIASLFGADESRSSFLGYTEHTTLAALAPLIARHRLRLIVRPHPREDVAALETFIATLPGDVVLQSAPALADAVASARLVVGMMTIGLTEAALRGASVISAQIGRRGVDPLASNRVQVTIPVVTESELASAVDELLRSPRSAADTRARIAALGWQPGAAKRLVAAIDSLVRCG